MTLPGRVAIIACFVLSLAAVAPRITPAPLGPGQPAASAKAANPPAEPQPAYTLPPDKLAKAIALDRIRNVLEIAGAFWGLAVLWLLLATGFAFRLEAWMQGVARARWVQGLLFFVAFFLITAVADLPLSLAGHIASLHYGISVQSWASWFADLGKALALTLAIGPWILLLFNWIVRRWPRRYWLIGWAVAVPLMVASVFVSPLVEPLFNQYEPLQKSNPALVGELEKVVARTGTKIPPDRMFLMKASLKTNGLNAYVSGLGSTKRIVVWDTTAGRIPNDQVLFIFGHESGHYVLHHLPKGMAVTAVFLFFLFWACAQFAEWMARRFGPGWRLGAEPALPPIASRAGFVVLLLAVSIAQVLVEPVGNVVSRHFEHQADVYGQEAIHGIVPDPQKTAVAAFNSLGEAWLEDPNPNPFIEFWTYSHPSVQNRAKFAQQYDPWAGGGRGEFFNR